MTGRNRTYRPGFVARFLPSGRWKLTLNPSTPGLVQLFSGGRIDLPCLDVTAISVGKALLWHRVDVRSHHRVDSLACLGERAAQQLAADLHRFLNNYLSEVVASHADQLIDVDIRLRPSLKTSGSIWRTPILRGPLRTFLARRRRCLIRSSIRK